MVKTKTSVRIGNIFEPKKLLCTAGTRCHKQDRRHYRGNACNLSAFAALPRRNVSIIRCAFAEASHSRGYTAAASSYTPACTSHRRDAHLQARVLSGIARVGQCGLGCSRGDLRQRLLLCGPVFLTIHLHHPKIG